MKTLSIFLLTSLISITTLQAQSGWYSPASTDDVLNTVCFVDSLTGWVGGTLADVMTGVIRKTRDGGSTWIAQPLPVTDKIYKLVFLNASTGFASGKNGTILKTTNGGATWVKKPSGTTADLFSIFFLNDQLGWACSEKNVLLTTDGGESWSSRSVPTSDFVKDITFKNAREGLVVGAYACYKTVDGGNTWQWMLTPIGGNAYNYCIQYLSPTRIMVMSDMLLYSTNAGATWSAANFSGSFWGGFFFADSLTGWVAGVSGIAKSTDGGAHWNYQMVRSNTFINAVHSPDGIHVWAAGQGIILKIVDRIPPASTATSTIAASPLWIPADGQSTSTITVQLKSADGNNVTSSGGTVLLKASSGSIGEATDLKNGSYIATYTASMTTGTATITGTLNGATIAASATVQLLSTSPAAFPLTIGTMWYYQHNAKAPRYGYDSMYAIRKEITDTLKNGFRIVRITNYFKSKTTTELEYLYFNDGKFYQTTHDSLHYEDFPRYNDTYTTTMTFGGGYGQNWVYTPGTSSIFGVTAKSQIELTYWQLHGGSSSETYTTVLGFGVIRYSVNSGDAADRSDSTVLVGMVKNGVIFGDTVLVDPDKRPMLLTPSDNNRNQIIGHYAFTWMRALGGISYRLQIATDSLFTHIFQDSSATTDTVKSINGFADATEYFWRVQAQCSDGGSYWSFQRRFTTGGHGTPGVLSTAFTLDQNYPNPFNPSTTISFSLPAQSFVTLKIFDVMGREVATIASEEMAAGSYSRSWNASVMPSGMYFYRLSAGNFIETKKLLLIR